MCTELFYAIIPTLFLDFLLICYPYVFNIFYSCRRDKVCTQTLCSLCKEGDKERTLHSFLPSLSHPFFTKGTKSGALFPTLLLPFYHIQQIFEGENFHRLVASNVFMFLFLRIAQVCLRWSKILQQSHLDLDLTLTPTVC